MNNAPVKINNEIRTASQIASHLARSIAEIVIRWINLRKSNQDSPFPSTAKEIVDEYKLASDDLIKGMSEEWNDESFH